MRRGHRLHSVHGAEPDMAGLARLPSVHRCLMVMVVVVYRSTLSRTSSMVMCSFEEKFDNSIRRDVDKMFTGSRWWQALLMLFMSTKAFLPVLGCNGV